jgi:lipopolysaccharide/colanic/teichoic acid biosynthesis glycosyltransferase
VSTYKIRYWAKPGLTGLAQTRGLRGGGAAATDELLEERIRADVYYIENWSLVLDLRILIETVVRTLFVPSTLQPKAR